jgi:hypothetical protein
VAQPPEIPYVPERTDAFAMGIVITELLISGASSNDASLVSAL